MYINHGDFKYTNSLSSQYPYYADEQSVLVNNWRKYAVSDKYDRIL